MGTYLRGFLGDFGESEIGYKIETVEPRSEKFRSSAHSILKRGGRRLRCGRGKTMIWRCNNGQMG